MQTMTAAELVQQMSQLSPAQRAQVERDAQQAQLTARQDAFTTLAEEQAKQVDDVRAVLHEQFVARAAGKPWADGLLPHQWTGMEFGAGARRWLLGDGMGLGKTRTTIGWLDLVGARRVVIVCQAEIAAQFAGEVMDLAPHRPVYNLSKNTPAVRHRLLDEATESDATIVVNYEMFRRDKDALAKLIAWHADSVIIDEAHNLKSTSSSNYKLMQLLVGADNVCGRCGGHIYGLRGEDKKYKPCGACGWMNGQPSSIQHEYPLDRHLHTKSVKNLALTTGTPILNSPDDIYPLLHLIDPIQFATRGQFLELFCVMNYASGKLEFRHAGLDRLKALIRGRYIARTQQDAGIVLPPQHVRIVRVDMDPKEYPKQLRVVQQISKSARIVLESGDTHNIMHLMTLILRKRQANVWPAGITIRDAEGEVVFSVGTEVQESCKIDAVCSEIARQHGRGRRQIVFSQFQTALVALQARLERDGYRVARFDGSTPDSTRAAIKEDFYRAGGADHRWDIVLVHYRSGGTGLNLQQATVTHILDEEWNPGRRDQAYARTHRMGQEQETEVFVYRVPGGVDSWMANLIRRKERIIGDFSQDIDTAGELKAQILAG